jgi:hypothetical protein
VGQSLARNHTLVKDGTRSVRVRGLTDFASYPRQRLKQQGTNGKSATVIPLNGFLEDIRPGIGMVSRNVAQETVETATEHSYRKAEVIIHKKFGRETIRRAVLQRGERAKTLPQVLQEARVVPEAKLKDAQDPATGYRKSKGSGIRQRLGRFLNLERCYLLIDGVQVFQKDKGPKGEESRECKVGTILCQNEGKISEIAAWCTWGRIKAFRALTDAARLAAATALNIPVVIVSDGAKWIRNTRKWIPGLKNAVWILDWFHCKDHLLKCLRAFGIEEASDTAQVLTGLLWNGRAEEVARMIKDFPLHADAKRQSEEETAIGNFLGYLNRQHEGIINYGEYQRDGYIVGSGFVEKLNDTLIKNRMVRGKRMRWSLPGGEAMMALLAAKHNGRLQEVFA